MTITKKQGKGKKMNSKNKDALKIFIGYVFAFLVGLFVYLELRLEYETVYAVLIANVAMTMIVFIGSVIYNNSSFYDPYWSVVPPVLIFVFMVESAQFSIWFVPVFIGVCMWSHRLTLNWYKNFVGFKKEDFRYQDFREKFPKMYWLVSLLAVHMFPTLIVYLGLMPIYIFVNDTVSRPFFVIVGTVIILSGTVISYFADEQMRDHQKNQYEYAMKEGLWSISRHPNYLGELMMWFGVMVVSFSVSYDYYQTFGFLAMLSLFEFYSIPRMEKRLLERKEDYEEIKLNISRVFPLSYIRKSLFK